MSPELNIGSARLIMALGLVNSFEEAFAQSPKYAVVFTPAFMTS